MARTESNNHVDYLLKNIPGDLWDAFKAKCETESPPMSMKWALLMLAAKFCNYDLTRKQLKARRPRRIVEPQAPPAAPVSQPAPDVDFSF